MDALQSFIPAPALADIDLPDEAAFAPAAYPPDDGDRWTGDVDEPTVRAPFPEFVGGGPVR
jgi:hypothetical protein